jgi:3-hydroxy acid dehydrogenase/malonic semialdehyde reductase
MAKTIVITGATSGFGRACAELFAAGGWQLVICGRREERLRGLARQLGGVPVHCACFDVRQLAAVENMVAGLPENFRAVDVLVNNAGLALGLNPVQSAELGDWEVMIDTNIKGLLYMTRLLLPGMVERKRGHIINIGSIAGTWPYPGGNAYGATKAFVGQFSNNLRCDLHGTGVRVTNIEPGLAATEFSMVRFGGDKGKADAVYAGTEPLTAVDIAEIVHWVACRPAHVNINRVEVMPVCQSWSPFAIDRQPK